MSKDRFKDALWYDKNASIIVGGSGGIGSWFSFFSTRAGLTTTVLDYDIVEEHNLGGQLFLTEDIGSYKVDALSNVVSLFNDCDYKLFSYKDKIDEQIELKYYIINFRSSDIVFIVSAFDNMKAREDLFNKAVEYKKEYPFKPCYFIDGRLLMEQMRIYCVNLDSDLHINDYKTNHIFPDSDVEDVACTMKQASHGAAMIATHMLGFITNIISNELVWKSNVFKVPYMWDYIIPLNSITEIYEPTS